MAEISYTVNSEKGDTMAKCEHKRNSIPWKQSGTLFHEKFSEVVFSKKKTEKYKCNINSKANVHTPEAKVCPSASLNLTSPRAIHSQLVEPGYHSASSSETIRVLPDKCNNDVQMSRKTSIQATQTNDIITMKTKYSLGKKCNQYDCSKLYCQKKYCSDAYSFRKLTKFHYKPSCSSSRRTKHDIVPLSNCLFELQTVFNYLLVIFIMCQLSNLGILTCVSCYESHSTFSYKHSKYQYPPYAPPSNLYNSKRFLASARSDSTIRERNENGIHGPNTLPLYEPHHANVSHFSEGK